MCDAPTDKIKNAQLLLDYFDEWPCFHDAEIKSIHLDSGNIDSDNDIYINPTMTMEFAVVDWRRWVNREESFDFSKNSVLVILKFSSFIGFEIISRFTFNYMMDELVVKEKVINEVTGAKGFWVEVNAHNANPHFWQHSTQEPAIEFECVEIEVVSVERILTDTEKKI